MIQNSALRLRLNKFKISSDNPAFRLFSDLAMMLARFLDFVDQDFCKTSHHHTGIYLCVTSNLFSYNMLDKKCLSIIVLKIFYSFFFKHLLCLCRKGRICLCTTNAINSLHAGNIFFFFCGCL